MPERNASVWDAETRAYKVVPDDKIERYISVCCGFYLFDTEFDVEEIQFNYYIPEMTDKGIVFRTGSVVFELEDIPEIIDALKIILESKKGQNDQDIA